MLWSMLSAMTFGRALIVLAVAALAVVPARAQRPDVEPRGATGRPDAEASVSASAARAGSPSRSVGAPDRGRLEDGVELTATRGVRLRSGPGGRWGTAELVGLIQRAAARVQDEAPGPPLLVGHLSARRGGPLRPHESHQSGRDADLGFFVTDEDGAPVDTEGMIRLDEYACGRAAEGPICIDGRRTFLLIAAMVEDPEARVQWILMSSEVREQVLAAGRRMGARAEVLAHVAEVTRVQCGSEAHRDHLHVRIYCPRDDVPRCVDHPPYHALYEGERP